MLHLTELCVALVAGEGPELVVHRADVHLERRLLAERRRAERAHERLQLLVNALQQQEQHVLRHLLNL